MKKNIVILAITALLVSCIVFMGIVVNAETSASVGNISSGRGKEVTFEVKLNETVKAKSGAVTLTFDHTVMRLVTGDSSKTGWTIPEAALATVDPRTEKGAFACMNETEISGTILKVTFKVLDDAAFGKTNVECAIQFRNSSNKNLPVTNVAGSITVVCIHEYDNSCDAECNICKERRTVKHQWKGTYSHDKNGHWHECLVCGEKTDEGKHSGGSATCVKKAVCSVCKIEYGTVDSAKHGKTELRGTKVATCVDKGYTGDTYCKDCGTKTGTGTAIAATGVHKWDNGTVTKKATHTETGIKTYKCTTCGGTKTETIPVTTEHTFGKWESVGADNHRRTCECGETETAKHTWDTGTVTKAATHSETGIKIYKCTACGGTKTETIPVTIEHTFGKWESVGADNHRRTCECGESETATHTWDNGTVTKEMTHTEDGIVTYTCTDCSEIKTDAVKAVSDHVWGEAVETKPATHTEDGEKTYTCEICGETKSEVVPKSEGHTFGDWKNDAASHWKECGCGEKDSVGEHSFGDWTVTKEATETEKGSKERSCTICGYKATEEIPQVQKSPQTGDDVIIVVSILIAIGMAFAIAMYIRRRKLA